ncbi:MAG: phosphatidate cytidylyltransferase [Sulfurospirillum sp.]
MNIKEIYTSHKERILTSIVLVGVALIVALVDKTLLTWVMMGAIYLVSFYEAMSLFGLSDKRYMVYAVALWLAVLIYPNPDDLFYLIIIVAVSVMVHKKDVNLRLLSPFVYPTLSMLFLFALYKDFGMSTLIWLVVIVASTDTGAYVTGKSIGKTPFSKTSPNKTWEGVIGGILIATVLGSIIGLGSVDLSISVIVSFFAALSSVWGDLFESYLKRVAGVKDSGTIFPGHGGMLDRLDGYLFASIVMVVLLRGLL